MPDDGKLSAKDVYEKSYSMFIYFLDWRHKLFAGYLACLAAIAVAYSKLSQYGIVLAGTVLVLSVIFWMIDFRIRDLYRHCSKAAEELERGSGVKGSFVCYEEGQKKFHPVCHSMAFDTLTITVFSFALIYVLSGRLAITASICIGLGIGIIPRVALELLKTKRSL